MTRTFPTLALIGVAALGSFAWLQDGRASDAPETDAQPDAAFLIATDTPAEHGLTAAEAGAVVPPGPHAEAVHALLAAAPGAERDAAAERFRERGPEGFAALRTALAPVVASYGIAKQFGFTERVNELEPLIRLLDQVAAQRDAYAAGLYWYTDFDAAKQQAQATGKPILSLRMLGNLDDEYSCANSRFFRTALYADARLGETLREEFVLHWQSVRPVPVITIDMGDGRVIRRTITGNSCHLVLDPHGRPVDVIPGLYGPRTFEDQLQFAAGALNAISRGDRAVVLTSFHRSRASQLDLIWAARTPVQPVTSNTPQNVLPFNFDDTAGSDSLVEFLAVPAVQSTPFPDARRAGLLAMGKGLVEAPMIDAMSPGPSAILLSVIATERTTVDIPDARDALRVGGKMAVEEVLVDVVLPRVPMQLPADASAEVWESVAAYYAEGAALDDSSRMLMRHKAVPAEVAARMAFSKSRVEDPLLAMVQNFEHAIALDTARNEHLLHREIHQWFVDGEAPMDPDALTSRVYDELFLTPDEDPWLGLVPPDTYSALDARGLETCE